MSIKIKQIR